MSNFVYQTSRGDKEEVTDISKNLTKIVATELKIPLLGISDGKFKLFDEVVKPIPIPGALCCVKLEHGVTLDKHTVYNLDWYSLDDAMDFAEKADVYEMNVCSSDKNVELALKFYNLPSKI